MLRYFLLGLCLTPLIAQAELACLEGPHGGKCHTVDINGEVFKTAEPIKTTTVTLPAPSATNQPVNKQQRINTVIPVSTNKQLARQQQVTPKNMTNQLSTPEQRIRQRAKLIESRFMRKQSMRNISQLDNNNNSYIKRKQQSAELRKRIED